MTPPGLEPKRRLEPWFTHLGLLFGRKFWSRGEIQNRGRNGSKFIVEVGTVPCQPVMWIHAVGGGSPYFFA